MSTTVRLAPPAEVDVLLAKLSDRFELLHHVRRRQHERKRLLEQVAEIDRELESKAEAVHLIQLEYRGAP